VKRGNTSMTINIEVWVKKVSSEPIGQRYKATEALFIYVAVDNQGKPRALPANKKAPGVPGHLQKAEQREEEVAENNHDHRQHVQREILHQDRMARHHNAFSDLLAR
jgi:acyl-CoA hydrolase